MKFRQTLTAPRSTLNTRECFSNSWLPRPSQREPSRSRSEVYTPINYSRLSKGEDGSIEQTVDQLRSGYISFKADLDKIHNNLEDLLLSEGSDSLPSSRILSEVLEDIAELRKKLLNREHIIKGLINIATEACPKPVKLFSPGEAALKIDQLQAMNKKQKEHLTSANIRIGSSTSVYSPSPRLESRDHIQPRLSNIRKLAPREDLDKLLKESQSKNEIYSGKLKAASSCIQRFLSAMRNLQKSVAMPEEQMKRLRKEFELNKTQLFLVSEDLTRIDELSKEDISIRSKNCRTQTPDQTSSKLIFSHPLLDQDPSDFIPPQFQSILNKTKDEYEAKILVLKEQINEYKSKSEQHQQNYAKLLKENEYSVRKFSDSKEIAIQEYEASIQYYQENELNLKQLLYSLMFEYVVSHLKQSERN